MTILKDTIVENNARATGSFKIGVSGEMNEGDFRAINGDSVLNAGIVFPYKQVLYLENGYDQSTVPIIIDETVKKTRVIAIQVIAIKEVSRNIPRYIQLYDPDNWISSFTPGGKGLDIYISTSSNRDGIGGNWSLYGGDRMGGTITLIITTNSGNIQSIDSSLCIISNVPNNALMYHLHYAILENGNTINSTTGGKTLNSIISDNCLKYTIGGSAY